jgi:uncharacterized membrane protein
MRTRIAYWWDELRAAYWFLPTLLAVAAAALVHLTLWIDRTFPIESGSQIAMFVFTGGASGAFTLLSTVAASMITVAATVFTITIVALALASTQYGPRLLRTFMYDTGTQVVLGVFIATFVYCLRVMLVIDEIGARPFVPHLSVTIAILMALASLGVLIYFFQHVSSSIQAYSIITAVGRDLEAAINRVYPDRRSATSREADPPAPDPHVTDLETQSAPVMCPCSGYLQVIDREGLLHYATRADVTVRVDRRPGDFIAGRSGLARVGPSEKLDERLATKLRECFIIGAERTHTQDVEFPINQLVQLCLRALSPAVNDPITAMMCIDRLGAAFCHLATRDLGSGHLRDGAGRVRVVIDPPSFKSLIDAALNPIRQNGQNSVPVVLRLLETIGVIASQSPPGPLREALRTQAVVTKRSADAQPMDEHDRSAVASRYENTIDLLEDNTAG